MGENMFKQGDRVFVNYTSSFSQGSYGVVTAAHIEGFPNTVWVKRDGSKNDMGFDTRELDLIEKEQQMKSIKSDKPCEPTITYPCLMHKPANGLVVLMTKDKRGTVIYTGSSDVYDVGDTSEGFLMFHFTLYNGSVCLEN